MKYVYCLTRDTETADDLAVLEGLPAGLGGAAAYYISFGGIRAVVSNIDSDHLIDSVQNALAHREVVDAALKFSRSIIPCRFGTLFPDDKSILAFLEEHYELLNAQLTRLEGKIEVSVEMILDRGMETPESVETEENLTTGASYLLKKKRRFDAIKELNKEADRFSQELNQAMSHFCSDVKEQRRTTERILLLSICYLLDQRDLPAFKSAYHRFRAEKPDVKLLYTGPWPPYSFADIDFRIYKE